MTVYRSEELVSACCGVAMYDDCDLCPECKEHTEAVLLEEEDDV